MCHVFFRFMDHSDIAFVNDSKTYFYMNSYMNSYIEFLIVIGQKVLNSLFFFISAGVFCVSAL